MTRIALFVPWILSFSIALFLLPHWIKKAHDLSLIWSDMNKTTKEKVAGSGGLIVILAFTIGLLVFVAYRTFILQTETFLIELFATLSVILFLTGVGLIDDLLGWKKGGLKRTHRLLLAGIAAIPLMAINAGKSEIGLPFIGTLELGLIYPLILIPIGIAGAAYTFNFLAGFNGLEAGQGIILLSAIGVVSFLTGNSWLTMISLIMIASLAGFLFYNAFPARVFPGDTMTYAIGGLIAIIAILGNFEKIAVFFFIPYILETALKSRGKLVKHSFGKPKKDGSLDLRYDKFYSLNHVAIYFLKSIGIKPTEQRVVYAIWTFQIIVIIAGFVMFSEGIF